MVALIPKLPRTLPGRNLTAASWLTPWPKSFASTPGKDKTLGMAGHLTPVEMVNRNPGYTKG